MLKKGADISVSETEETNVTATSDSETEETQENHDLNTWNYASTRALDHEKHQENEDKVELSSTFLSIFSSSQELEILTRTHEIFTLSLLLTELIF